ncbi:UrcA family protein [Sphingomonas laterariae]|uniref:UrcA family protein n=1 Tax=Edaphosphingomonas laterariae TaxID=861865 RepID=A0A239FHF2_9SPHN|nr:UrcA family protein [Sphingomonas laterariae]SNS56175.1 UrcA family protein [Sphingomonas laterariae]
MFTRFARTGFFTALSIVAASATVVAVSPASAQSESRSQQVRFGDIDLRSDDGLAELNSRIDNAAKDVCGVSDARTIQEISVARKCARVAIADTAGPVQLAVAEARSQQGYASNEVSVRAGR